MKQTQNNICSGLYVASTAEEQCVVLYDHFSHPGLILLESDPSSHHTLAGHTSAEGNVCSGWSKGQVRSKPTSPWMHPSIWSASWSARSEALARPLKISGAGIWRMTVCIMLANMEIWTRRSKDFGRTLWRQRCIFSGAVSHARWVTEICVGCCLHGINFWLTAQALTYQFNNLDLLKLVLSATECSAQRNKSLLNTHGKSVEMRYSIISCISHDACTHWRSTFQFCGMFRHPKD